MKPHAKQFSEKNKNKKLAMSVAAAARFVCRRRKIPSGMIAITHPQMVPFLVTYAITITTRLPTFLQPVRFCDDAAECESSSESFNEWGAGEMLDFPPRFGQRGGEGTARKYPLPGTSWTNPLVKGAPIYNPWVFTSNHNPRTHAMKTPGNSGLRGVFSIPVGQPDPTSLTPTQTPLPQLTAWSLFMAGA